MISRLLSLLIITSLLTTGIPLEVLAADEDGPLTNVTPTSNPTSNGMSGSVCIVHEFGCKF